MKSEVRYKVVGPVETNCYLLINTETKQAVVIDPGHSGEFLAQRIKELGVNVDTVLLTHGHFDHIGGIDAMREIMEIHVIAGENEKGLLADPEANCSHWTSDDGFSVKVDQFVRDGEILNIAGFNIKCIETPGHTAGGMCFYIESEKLLFAGDTLFYHSFGRTDLPTGSLSDLIKSIKNKIMVLPEDTRVLCGHGEETTIADEIKYNPVFEYCSR